MINAVFQKKVMPLLLIAFMILSLFPVSNRIQAAASGVGSAPTVTIASSESNPTNNGTIPITISFSEPVTGFSLLGVDVGNAAASNLQTVDNITYTVNITPASDGEVTVGVPDGAGVNIAGKGNTASALFYITYDTTAPTLTISSSESSPTNSSTIPVTIGFSEAVTNFAMEDVAVSNGTAGNFQTLDNKTYTVDIIPASVGQVTLEVAGGAAIDAAGNGSMAAAPFSIIYSDTTVPAVTIASNESNPTNNGRIPISIRFSEAVTGFTLLDIEAGNAAASNLQTFDNITYTVDITPASDGEVTVRVPDGAAVDAAGNGSTASALFHINYDTTAPVLTISSSEASTTNSGTIPVTIRSTEAVTNFVLEDVAVSNGTAGNLQALDSQTYTVDVTPASDGEVIINVPGEAAEDAAGNGSTASALFHIISDTTAPVLTISSSESSPTNSGTIPVTIRSSEAVTNFAMEDVAVSNGTAGNLQTLDSQAYTVDVTPASDGEVIINVPGGAAVDAAGNSSKAAAPFSMTYHSPTPPVTSPTPPVTSPTPTQPAMPSEPGTNDWEFDILVNGRAERVGKAAIQEANDQQVTTITMDEEKLAQLLKEEGERAVIIIPVTTDSDVVIAELNGRLVKDMEAQQNVVEVRTMQAAYTLPAEQINIDAISQRFGTNVGLQDIKVRLEIAKPSPEAIHMVELAAANDGFALAAPPVNFKVSAVHGDRQEEVTKFNAYVEHSVALPEGADPSHITTGIVVEPDGTVRPVPTRIAVIDGKSYAQINSLISGMYSVVWHSLAFKDVENHWAKEAVNDMGSRMVIDGIGNGLFLPDQSISRADFAAIMVRGLGLQLESGSTPFTDMCQKEEGYQQAVITAYSYGLVSGFEDGSFRPLDKITREQAMVIIAKAMKITYLQGVNAAQTSDHVLHSFTDAINVSDWAKSSFAICVQAGIVSGRDNGQLEPKAFITRAETALIMQRLLQKSDLI